jgi:hypothetical protein
LRQGSNKKKGMAKTIPFLMERQIAAHTQNINFYDKSIILKGIMYYEKFKNYRCIYDSRADIMFRRVRKQTYI